jgi:hypothetical protein
MATQVVRVETPARWQLALSRAIRANLSYMELIGGDGAWAVSSTRDEEQGYVVTLDTCTCAAGRGGDPICCHRALVRALTGLLPLDPPPATIACGHCSAGRVEEWTAGHISGSQPCSICGGTGRLAVPAPIGVSGASAVDRVAHAA